MAEKEADDSALASAVAEVSITEEDAKDPKLDSSLSVLRDIQERYDVLYNEFLKQRRALEESFEKKFCPFYKERSNELENGHIPNFWLIAFEHCEMLSENITEKDADCLAYLRDVTCMEVSTSEQSSISDYSPTDVKLTPGSYVLSFHFAPNPYFVNDVLTKSYVMQAEEDQELDQAIGCPIEWKPGKDLTVRIMKKKIRGSKGGAGRTVTKKEPCDSFFNFFSPPKFPDGEGEVDEEEVEALEEVIEADYDLGETIRHDIIPRAILYFDDKIEGHSDDEGDEEGDEKDEEDEEDHDKKENHSEDGFANGSANDDTASDDSDNSEDRSPKAELPPPAQTAEECKQQ